MLVCMQLYFDQITVSLNKIFKVTIIGLEEQKTERAVKNKNKHLLSKGTSYSGTQHWMSEDLYLSIVRVDGFVLEFFVWWVGLVGGAGLCLFMLCLCMLYCVL